MGFLDIFRPKNTHIEDLKALIVEYKLIIDELKKEKEELKKEIEKLKVVDEKPTTSNDVKKKLSKKEKQVYDFYSNMQTKNIDLLVEELKMPLQHVRVYKSRIEKKGYLMNFE